MYHRDDLIKVQKEVREITGVTAIIYVQTCATELRRRRKRGLVADRDIKMFINPDVCEGCGDCAEKSNCVAVKPLDHFDGTKKQIDQSVCNKDYSCSKGFCPSFIGVTSSKSLETMKKKFPSLPLNINNLQNPKEKIKDIKNIIMAGIGGTGVSTIAAIIAIKIDHPSDITPEDFFVNQLDNIENLDVLAFEDALENDSIGLTTKDAQNEASNDA